MTPIEMFWQSLRQPIKIGTQVFAFSLSNLILEFLVPLLVYVVLAVVFWGWLKVFLRTGSASDNRKERIQVIAKAGVVITGLLLAIILGSRFLELRLLRFFEDFYTIITKPFYQAGGTELSLLTLVLAIPVVYLAGLSGKAARIAVEKSRLITQILHDNRRQTVATLVRYGVFVLVMVLGFSIIGFDLSSIGVFLGILMAGLLFGLHQVLINFFAGLGLILTRLVKEGDYINLVHGTNTHEGFVEQIRLLHVVIVAPGGVRTQIPSNAIYHGVVRIEGRAEGEVPLYIELDVHVQTDIENLERAIAQVVAKSAHKHPEHDASVTVIGVTNSKLHVQVQIPLSSGAAVVKARAEMWREICITFKKSGISFA